MTITTVDGLLAGMQPPQDIVKVGAGTQVAGRFYSLAYATGRPGSMTNGTPGAGGVALTTFAGQVPFNNPVSGNTYLARFEASASQAGTLYLCDRLWYNTGLSVTTSPGAQTVNSVAWPARDLDGSTNGNGVLIGVEVTSAMGAGTPTLTLTYTNSANAGSQTATQMGATTASAAVGSFWTFGLAAGSLGVRSVQSLALSATWTSGAFSLVAYRVLAMLPVPTANLSYAIDALTSGFPRLYDNTVPFLLWLSSSTTAPNVTGRVVYAQG